QDAPILAVLDAANVHGAAPAEAGTGFACQSCSAGGPLRYFVLPRPELHRAAALAPQPPYPQLKRVAGGFELHTYMQAAGSPGAEAIYEFNADLEPVRASMSDAY